jgi:gliding motility-associated-like protein
VVKGDLLDYELFVFNRWGELIFSTDKQGTLWDGRYKGEPVQDGVYVWMVNYRAFVGDGIKQDRLIGHVTVLR